MNRRTKADDPEESANRLQNGSDDGGRASDEENFDGGRLNDLQARVSQAQKTRQPDSAHSGRGSAIGMAYRLSMELVVGILVGGFIGWWLDRWLSTEPVFLLVMLVLGMIAGIVNMLRTARDMKKVLGVDETPAVKNSESSDSSLK